MRIIAGSAKGRQIETLEGLNTRPTLARVKEALFGSIQFDLAGSTVLDLFSGNGGLGLEAASRGARLVILNDHARPCAELIKRNAAHTKLTDRVEVWQYEYQDAIDRAEKMSLRFDIALIDAPYHEGFAGDAARRLFQKGLIKAGGYVIVEHARDCAPRGEAGLMQAVWTHLYGECGLTKLKGDS